jgi:hypothetical protein
VPTPPIPRELVQQAVDALARNNGVATYAARELGLARETFNGRLRTAARYGIDCPGYSTPEGFEIRARTVRLNSAGEITGQTISTAQERGEQFEPIPGHVVKGESVLLDADGRVSARWVKTREGAQQLEALTEALQAALADVPVRPLISPPATSDADLLTLYPVADLHMGMMAWGRETGADYDVAIASELAVQSARELVSQSRPSRQAVVLGLGDYFHQNDKTNMTPRSGHVLDVDGRWPKVLLAGCEVAITIIDAALQKHDEVHARFLPGNHDPDAAVALSIALSLAYRGNTRVTIDLDPSLHWYMRFGRVLMGATHGHTMKPDRMAMMLASDRPEDWGQASFKHFFFGHIHHDTGRDVGPVRVESFRTIAAKDGYAHAGGYRAPRSMSAITFHAERGEIGRHKVHIS